MMSMDCSMGMQHILCMHMVFRICLDSIFHHRSESMSKQSGSKLLNNMGKHRNCMDMQHKHMEILKINKNNNLVVLRNYLQFYQNSNG